MCLKQYVQDPYPELPSELMSSSGPAPAFTKENEYIHKHGGKDVCMWEYHTSSSSPNGSILPSSPSVSVSLVLVWLELTFGRSTSCTFAHQLPIITRNLRDLRDTATPLPPDTCTRMSF